jgi:hypothetical protein
MERQNDRLLRIRRRPTKSRVLVDRAKEMINEPISLELGRTTARGRMKDEVLKVVAQNGFKRTYPEF